MSLELPKILIKLSKDAFNSFNLNWRLSRLSEPFDMFKSNLFISSFMSKNFLSILSNWFWIFSDTPIKLFKLVEFMAPIDVCCGSWKLRLTFNELRLTSALLSSLTNTPKLPATILVDDCYSSMFSGCKSLTNAPELPATTLANNCYGNMFYNCTSLTNAPELPATTLADYCYGNMFSGCKSLTNAPELPATILTNNCYIYMFSKCTSLKTTPKLPATTLTTECYSYMFRGCTSLTTAPELPATTLANNCYRNMFYGCNKLNYIKMLATDISATECLSSWVYGVSSTGTFVKDPNMTSLLTGTSGIPNGWTVQDAA